LCLQKFEFTPEGIAKRAAATVDYWKEVKPLSSSSSKLLEAKC
jgi:transketolase